MNVDVSERAFEDAIEACLLQHSGGAVAEERGSYLDMPPGGYQKRRDEDYDRAHLPHPAGRAGLRSGDTAPGVEEARPASWGCSRGAVPEAPVL